MNYSFHKLRWFWHLMLLEANHLKQWSDLRIFFFKCLMMNGFHLVITVHIRDDCPSLELPKKTVHFTKHHWKTVTESWKITLLACNIHWFIVKQENGGHWCQVTLHLLLKLSKHSWTLPHLECKPDISILNSNHFLLEKLFQSCLTILNPRYFSYTLRVQHSRIQLSVLTL